jgi:peptidoglycan/xylan/chitin deacetylase (PgdA/CDA1 family)
MMLLLTYHKIQPCREEASSEFYTVPEHSFRRQLDSITAAGHPFFTPEHLLHLADAQEAGCLLTFDDGTRDHYEIVFPELEARRLRAVFFVPTAKLNQSGYLTESEVRELSGSGHVIGLHSHHHQRMDTWSEDEMRAQMRQARELLGAITGREPWIFAPPGGFIDKRLRTVALASGVKAIRTMRWGYNRRPDLLALETIPLNRHITDPAFDRILAGRERRLLYFAKETTKRFLPAAQYERLRNFLFKSAGRG